MTGISDDVAIILLVTFPCNLGFKGGKEGHVILSKALEQDIVGLRQLWIVQQVRLGIKRLIQVSSCLR